MWSVSRGVERLLLAETKVRHHPRSREVSETGVEERLGREVRKRG